MSTPDLSDDERVFLDALDRLHADTPELLPLADHAVRAGTRIRRRRRIGAAVAAVAVVAVASSGAVLAAQHDGGDGSQPGFATAPTTAAVTGGTASPSDSGKHTGTKKDDASPSVDYPKGSVAYLDDPGYTLGPGQTSIDDKLYYTAASGDAQDSISLNWRPAADYDPKYTEGTAVRQISMGGAPATIYRIDGGYTITGVVRDGSFLTMNAPVGLDLDQLATLASHVHRV